MPSWFSKVFKRQENDLAASSTKSETDWSNPILAEEEPVPERKVVNAPVLVEMDTEVEAPDGIRIVATITGPGSCLFMVDKSVLPGYSVLVPSREDAHLSPLAQALFEADGIESVIIHDMNVMVHRTPEATGEWDSVAADIGRRIRAHLKEGAPVVAEDFAAQIPPEDEIRDRLQQVLDDEINPGIADHGGIIRLDRVEGNTAYIQMLGGCQGCAASQLTLREGVDQMFRNAVPQLGAILDLTDHTAGKNPFYREVPAEM